MRNKMLGALKPRSQELQEFRRCGMLDLNEGVARKRALTSD
jgi:hypothetical protein